MTRRGSGTRASDQLRGKGLRGGLRSCDAAGCELYLTEKRVVFQVGGKRVGLFQEEGIRHTEVAIALCV